MSITTRPAVSDNKQLWGSHPISRHALCLTLLLLLDDGWRHLLLRRRQLTILSWRLLVLALDRWTRCRLC